ncbi:MAG: hypothetical protein K1X78_23405 [Verrucomicrobiaceae bacterium]|nr:hypothetical protein [Verrucomicrobiaceae bacterium]
MNTFHAPRFVAGLLWLAGWIALTGGCQTAQAGPSGIGNLVFRDANANGKYDVGEGVPNVEVQLFASGADPLSATPVQSVFTGSDGKYLFILVDDGSYFVQIPPSEFQLGGDLAGLVSIQDAAGNGADDDVGEDGVDDLTPAVNGIRSVDFEVMANQAPTAATGETGFDSASDDADDANTNLTIDLGFYKPVGVGNLVFVDTNGNNHADPGEGVGGVIVRLYRAGDEVGVAIPAGEVTTDLNGEFMFSPIPEGSYFLHVPASEFAPGRPLCGAGSLPGIATEGDDDAGDDTLDGGNPAVDGVSSRTFALAAGLAPTDAGYETGTSYSSDIDDADTDLTIDLGFVLPPDTGGIGNLVFLDTNENGHADPGEGVDGVEVQLFDVENSAVPLSTQTTAGGGFYYFSGLPAGNYFVFIPPSQFGIDHPLQGAVAVPGVQLEPGDDDTGEDGSDNVEAPLSVTGSYSITIALSPGAAPTAATYETGLGAAFDNAFDALADLTVDFGFRLGAGANCGVGNLVFIDANENGHADSGEGVDDVEVRLFHAGDDPAAAAPVASTYTSDGGLYHFTNLPPGSYFVHIPASEFGGFIFVGSLHGMESLPGVGGDNGTDDNADENGIDATDLDVYGLSSVVFTLGSNQEPVSGEGTETGVDSGSDDGDDNNTDLTIDLGFRAAPPVHMQVGNLVFFDANGNGHAEEGEGVDGVTVQLYEAAAIPGIDTPVATTETASGGRYLFSDVAEGFFFVFIPPGEFQAGGQLAGKLSMAGAAAFGTYLDDDSDENGIDQSQPEVTGIKSGDFLLLANSQPLDSGTETGLSHTADDADDNNGDLTIDFGFVLNCPTITIAPSSLQNGTVGFAYAPVTFTASGGTAPYSWEIIGTLPAGITFSSGGVLGGTPSATVSASFAIRATDAVGCKVTSNYTLTIENPMSVGNLVYVDANWNSTFDAGEGRDGVQVQLYHSTDTPGTVAPVASAVTSGGGFYLLANLPTGSYLLHVPAAMFAPGAPLQGKASLPGVSPNTDDDQGEDGQDALDPATTGVSSAPFTLVNNLAPTAATYESGQQSATDDADDANTDLTRDFAFRTPAKPSTFTAWQAANPLGGDNGPIANPDHDASANLLEYATCLPPDSGLNSASAFRVTYNFAQARFEAALRRPLGGQQDLIFGLEGSTDPTLAGGWTPLGTEPAVTNNGDGTEAVSFNSFNTSPAYSGANSGFVRLRVDLDANHDGNSEAIAFSEVWSWASVTLQPWSQTFSLPVLNADVFTGIVSAVGATTLDVSGSLGTSSLAAALQAGIEYYVEVTDGDNEGHRFEVDVTNCTATTIALNTAHARSTLASLPASLAGDTLVLRKHWTLKDALPVSRLRATNNATTSDRIQFYEPATGISRTLWLYLNGGNRKWVLSGDATLADAGTRVINTNEGTFFSARLTATLPLAGIVRRNDSICPLVAGMNLVGTSWPVWQSAASRDMTVGGGFTGATSVTRADRVRNWNGDTANDQTFTGRYLLKTTTLERWVREGDASLTDESTLGIFAPYHAAYIQARSARSAWKMPSPTGP